MTHQMPLDWSPFSSQDIQSDNNSQPPNAVSTDANNAPESEQRNNAPNATLQTNNAGQQQQNAAASLALDRNSELENIEDFLSSATIDDADFIESIVRINAPRSTVNDIPSKQIASEASQTPQYPNQQQFEIISPPSETRDNSVPSFTQIRPASAPYQTQQSQFSTQLSNQTEQPHTSFTTIVPASVPYKIQPRQLDARLMNPAQQFHASTELSNQTQQPVRSASVPHPVQQTRVSTELSNQNRQPVRPASVRYQTQRTHASTELSNQSRQPARPDSVRYQTQQTHVSTELSNQTQPPVRPASVPYPAQQLHASMELSNQTQQPHASFTTVRSASVPYQTQPHQLDARLANGAQQPYTSVQLTNQTQGLQTFAQPVVVSNEILRSQSLSQSQPIFTTHQTQISQTFSQSQPNTVSTHSAGLVPPVASSVSIATELDPTEEQNMRMLRESKKATKKKSSSKSRKQKERNENERQRAKIPERTNILESGRKSLPTYVARNKKYSVRNEHRSQVDFNSGDDSDLETTQEQSRRRKRNASTAALSPEVSSDEYVRVRRSKQKKAKENSNDQDDEEFDYDDMYRFKIGGERIEVKPNSSRLYLKHNNVKFKEPDYVKSKLDKKTTCYKNARKIPCDKIAATNNYLNFIKGPSIPDLCNMKVSRDTLLKCTKEEVRAFLVGLITYVSEISMRSCKNVFEIGKRLLYMYKMGTSLTNKTSDTKPIDCIEPKSLRESLQQISHYWDDLPKNMVTSPILHKKLNGLLSHGCSNALHYVFNGTTHKNHIVVQTQKSKANVTKPKAKTTKAKTKDKNN